MELLEMLNEYQALLEKKDILAKQTKENNQDIKVMMGDIAQEMIDADVPEMAVGDYVFSLRDKTEYSKKSNADLAEAGLDYFEVLREQGLGDLIVEQVNARTLNTAIKNLLILRFKERSCYVKIDRISIHIHSHCYFHIQNHHYRSNTGLR